MIWTNKTHQFAATNCPHLGRPCPAARRMLQTLTKAMKQAAPVTEKDFELAGHTQLDGCTQTCPARFVATHDRIRIYCAVSETACQGHLDQFADAILTAKGTGFPANQIREYPCALAQALPRPVAAPRSDLSLAY